MFNIVQRLDFCAGHRLMDYVGACSSMHGHNYTVYLHIASEKLDSQGMVVDFCEVRNTFGEWIKKHWDHTFICHKNDRCVLEALSCVKGQKIFTLDDNPTAENMAYYLLHVVGPQVFGDTEGRLVRVVVHETHECYAEVSL